MQTVKQQQPEKKLNLIEQISQRFTDKLMNTPFPMDRLSADWVRAAFIALDYASPVGMGISHNDLAALHRISLTSAEVCDPKPQLSYNQFAALSNNLDTKSASQLHMSGYEYSDLLIEAKTHIDFFGEQAAVMRKASEEEIAEETSDKKDKPTGAFATVKAEA